MKLRHILTLVFLLSTFVSFGAKSYTYKTVPNIYKMKKIVWVSNPEKIISEEIEQQLNDTISAYEARTSAEIVVVALNSIGKSDSKVFANRLFNHWKIGKKEKNNGLLILFVEGKREIVFETGSGMESQLTDDACYDIQQQLMIPLFKEGKYDEGLLVGVLGSMRYIDTGSLKEPEVEVVEEKNPVAELFEDKDFVLKIYGIPLVLAILSVLYAGRNSPKSFEMRSESIYNTAGWWVFIMLLLCINIPGMIAIGIFSVLYVRYLRSRERLDKCKKCYSHRLVKSRGETARPYLDDSQQKALDMKLATAELTRCRKCGDKQVVFTLNEDCDYCYSCGKFVEVERHVFGEDETATTDGFYRVYSECSVCHSQKITEDKIYPALNTRNSGYSSSPSSNYGYGAGLYDSLRDDDDDDEYEREQERKRSQERDQEREREAEREKEREREQQRERERQQERDSRNTWNSGSSSSSGSSSRGGGSSSGGGSRSGW